MLHVPDACACLLANDHKGPHLLLVCPAAGGGWQIHLARWQHVRGRLEGKLIICLHLRPLRCAALARASATDSAQPPKRCCG